MLFVRKGLLLILGILFVSLNTDAQVLKNEGRIGKTLPESFSIRLLQAPDTILVNSNVLKGNVVVLDFWGTWCAPCIKAIPHMNELAETFEDAPVQFISVTDESEAIVKRFLKRKKMRGWIGLDTQGALTRWAEIKKYPTIFILDKQGVVREVIDADQLSTSNINKYLDHSSNHEAND